MHGHTASDHVHRRIAHRTAPVMFALSVAFLVCQSILVVVWVDAPSLSESLQGDVEGNALVVDRIGESPMSSLAMIGMSIIWPIVVLESVYHWLIRPRREPYWKFHFYGLLFCLCPSLRMCARMPEMGYRLWLPGLGWRVANRRLQAKLQRQLSLPMIVIALMILPVLTIEFFFKAQVLKYATLRTLLHIGTGVIWFSFAAEFILMVSIAKKKLAYCREHWLDLAIIVIPLISFLRSLQLVRATSVLRLPQLTKMARVYRLRGTAVKLFRAFILLELVQRLTGHGSDRSVAKLKRRLGEIETEAKEIRRRIAAIERKRVAKTRVPADSRSNSQTADEPIH